ncbi:MAG: hypothetical protein MI746_18525 [Pseudomonadales bacterium]|nr:hypothetical protein [Pseudomonadales bacterium]
MNKSAIIKILMIFVCLAVAGPELGIGLELLVLLDLMGVELFLFAFSMPALFYGRMFIAQVQKLDPYFFISPRSDVIDCPALLAHAIPFFIVSLFFVVSSAVLSFFLGE